MAGRIRVRRASPRKFINIIFLSPSWLFSLGLCRLSDQGRGNDGNHFDVEASCGRARDEICEVCAGDVEDMQVGCDYL